MVQIAQNLLGTARRLIRLPACQQHNAGWTRCQGWRSRELHSKSWTIPLKPPSQDNNSLIFFRSFWMLAVVEHIYRFRSPTLTETHDFHRLDVRSLIDGGRFLHALICIGAVVDAAGQMLLLQCPIHIVGLFFSTVQEHSCRTAQGV